VAKKLASLEHGQRQTGKFAGLTTQAQAASMLNVSERSVRTAGSVFDKAIPEIVAAVEKGGISVSAAARFAKQPKEEQAKQIAGSATPADAVKAFRQGRRIRSARPVSVDGPRVVHSNDPKAAMVHPIGEVFRFAEFCRTNSSQTVTAAIPPGKLAEIAVSIDVIKDWLNQVVGALAGFKTTYDTAKRVEAPLGPDNAQPAKRAPVAPASDILPDIPPCLDRRRKGGAE
jgi:hypothetical protein